MSNIFLTSDTHFGHLGVCKFLRADGVTKLRPWDTAEEMDEAMVELWNKTVGPKDKVYHLGDVVINRRALPILDRLNGDKVLIRGNHDIFQDSDYTKYFRSLRGVHVMDGMIFTHIPVHESELGRFGVNVHGHTHANRVMRYKTFADGVVPSIPLEKVIDVRYHSVCVEQTDFKPIALEDVKQRIRDEGGTIGFKNGNGPL